MRVSVPLDTVVYQRRNVRECFVFRHVYKGSYIKHVPMTLSVGDLRQHAIDEMQRSERTHAPLLVLVTGKLAVIHTLANWDNEKLPVRLRVGEFGVFPDLCNTMGGLSCLPMPSESSLKTIKAATTKTQCDTGACGDINETHALIHTYTTLVTYGMRQGRYTARGACSMEATPMMIPRRLPTCELRKLEERYRYALEMAKSVTTWVLEDTGVQYNEVARKPKRQREED